MKDEVKRLEAEVARLQEEIFSLKGEMIRLVRRNLDLTERLEEDMELKRRVEVAREIFEDNVERQKNGNLKDDGQLMALIELRLEENRSHLNPDFDSKQLAELLGVTKSAVSHQLKALRLANLIKFRRDGQNVYYSLADDHVRAIIHTGFDHIKD